MKIYLRCTCRCSVGVVDIRKMLSRRINVDHGDVASKVFKDESNIIFVDIVVYKKGMLSDRFLWQYRYNNLDIYTRYVCMYMLWGWIDLELMVFLVLVVSMTIENVLFVDMYNERSVSVLIVVLLYISCWFWTTGLLMMSMADICIGR